MAPYQSEENERGTPDDHLRLDQECFLVEGASGSDPGHQDHSPQEHERQCSTEARSSDERHALQVERLPSNLRSKVQQAHQMVPSIQAKHGDISCRQLRGGGGGG